MSHSNSNGRVVNSIILLKDYKWDSKFAKGKPQLLFVILCLAVWSMNRVASGHHHFSPLHLVAALKLLQWNGSLWVFGGVRDKTPDTQITRNNISTEGCNKTGLSVGDLLVVGLLFGPEGVSEGLVPQAAQPRAPPQHRADHHQHQQGHHCHRRVHQQERHAAAQYPAALLLYITLLLIHVFNLLETPKTTKLYKLQFHKQTN